MSMAKKTIHEIALELAIRKVSQACGYSCPLSLNCARRGDECEKDLLRHFLAKAKAMKGRE